jgi:hypothetical protein
VAAGDDWEAVCASPDLQFETLLLNSKLAQFRALHQVDDLFDLFEIQVLGVGWT